jgi:AraC-like DNA-binding protein
MLVTQDVFRRLCRAREMLCELDERTLSVRDVARDVAISQFHFIRQFEAVFGLTPHRFRTRTRIDHAKQLLIRGELSVTEVCMELGFSSLGSFSDLFTRHVGTSPSAYRRRVHAVGGLPHSLASGCLSLMALLPEGAFRNFREA